MSMSVITIEFPPETPASVIKQGEIFVRALQVYAERNERYNDNWKRMGWRGLLVRIRERSERLWDRYWDEPRVVVKTGGTVIAHDADDAVDLINFAAFLVRALEQGETDRDGEWWS